MKNIYSPAWGGVLENMNNLYEDFLARKYFLI